jgi:predicted nucleic-acid-binding protein
MIAVDTNVIVRFLTRDDETQFLKAYQVFKERDIFIPDSVVLETEWVLRYAYNFSADEICNALKKLFGLPNVHLSNPVFITQAIEWREQGVDFADALHLALSQQYEQFLTFDKSYVKKAKGLCKCVVSAP